MFEARPIRFLRNLGRSREIATVLLNHGFADVVERLRLMRYFQWWRRVVFRRRQPVEPPATRAQRIRRALEELGPTFIKFGQVGSTRPDLLPADVIAELTKLQERVPTFSPERAIKQFADDIGCSVDVAFDDFQRTPLASGSLGQVHLAKLKNGKPVAVKIRRPGVVDEIERDLSLLLELAALAEKYLPEFEVFDPTGLVNQFARTIRREVNFMREARTLDEFRRLFRNDATLFVPSVHWDYTTESVLTMDFVDGLPVNAHEKMLARGISPADIAANGARIFMKQVFELGLFHGDPHPGNIRVMPDGVICLLDYGMTGRLDDDKREQLLDLMVAVARQDVGGVVNMVLNIGVPFREIDHPLLQSDVRDFVETYYGVDLERINIGNMLTDFVNVLAIHGIRFPADMMLLIRALVTLEGVGRDLDSHFNMAEHLAPYVQRLVRERYNPRNMIARFIDDTQAMGSVLYDLPVNLGRTLEKISRDDLRVKVEFQDLDRLTTEVDRSSNRVVIGMVLAALIVASSLIIRTGSDHFWISVPVYLLSSFLGLWLIYGIFRSGSL